jgi:hypothetical protein
VTAVLIGLLIGTWSVWSALNRGGPAQANKAEVSALESRLTAVRDAVQPIALSFTTDTAPKVIDVGEYRARIARVRTLVDTTNGMRASSETAREIRDLIVTGGAQVVDGLDAALDALQSDDASATDAPDALVAEGIGSLQEAQARINEALGRTTGN